MRTQNFIGPLLENNSRLQLGKKNNIQYLKGRIKGRDCDRKLE
jgi:hypothetical protein